MLAPALLAAALPALPAPADDGQPHFPAHFESIALPGPIHLAIDVEFLTDGSRFVSGKHGTVHFRGPEGETQATPVLDLSDEIVHTGDRGLLGIAAHPGFAPDGGPTAWLYLAYTVSPVPGADPLFDEDDKYSFSRLTRYRIVTQGQDVVADLGSRHVLIGNQLPDGSVPDGIASLWSSHAAGTLVFGTDGTLFVSAGDGGHADQFDPGGVDPAGFESFVHPETGLVGPMPDDQDCGAFRSQDLRSLAGKILRVDPETGLGLPSNPFFDGDPASNASKVWALGLRNPYSVQLVPGTGSPGHLLVGDVGWNGWEELNRCEGGENFRWPCFEGPHPQSAYDGHVHSPNPHGFPSCADPGPGAPTGPLLTWDHETASLMQPRGIHFDEHGTPQPGVTGSTALAGPPYPGGDYPDEYDGVSFFADYADEWIRTVRFDAQGAALEVVDFGFDVGRITDLAVHPLTGDLHYVTLGTGTDHGRLHRVRYGANFTPVASGTATPSFGDPPLSVSFDAGGSTDPDDDPLTFEWDFGDGSPPAAGETQSHTYFEEDLYAVQVTATDDGGLSDTATVMVAVGDVPPVAHVVAPLQGATFVEGQELLLEGAYEHFGGGSVTLSWTIDLYHDTHVHPDAATLDGASAVHVVEPHGEPQELFYLRIELRAETEAGLADTDHVFVYPETNLFDPTGTAPPIAKTQELDPPHPVGGGNHDLEIVRDAVYPPVGSTDRSLQFDSFHHGDQGDDDWIGLELPAPPGEESRFVGLVFQEGIHTAEGGWFEDMRVEVRQDGAWEEAENLTILPPYPFELAATPGFDGVGFERYELRFDPIHGDAVRLRGDPGGPSGFISAGELRALWITAAPEPPPWEDLSADGSFVAKVKELQPPLPQGDGNLDPETLRNGTWPPAGSASLFAQVDTFHFGDQGDEDWMGYAFDDWRTFERIVFQEGFHGPGGGWFEDLAVETRAGEGSPWQPVDGLVVTPPIPGDLSPAGTYETFEISFAPRAARGIRLVGDPGGTDAFVSSGELRVLGPATDAEACGWTAYGEGSGGANVLSLASTTPPVLGYPGVVRVTGAPGAGTGTLLLAAAPFELPVLGGVLLVDPSNAGVLPFAIGADGAGDVLATLPTNPALVGQSTYLQAFALDPGQPGGLAFSNGLELRLCP